MKRRTFLISGLQLDAIAELGSIHSGQIMYYLQPNACGILVTPMSTAPRLN